MLLDTHTHTHTHTLRVLFRLAISSFAAERHGGRALRSRTDHIGRLVHWDAWGIAQDLLEALVLLHDVLMREQLVAEHTSFVLQGLGREELELFGGVKIQQVVLLLEREEKRLLTVKKETKPIENDLFSFWVQRSSASSEA